MVPLFGLLHIPVTWDQFVSLIILIHPTPPQLVFDHAAAPSPAPQPMDHKITVGADGLLTYNPANISAAIGDTVTFEFHPKNHTVTQSSFSQPCQPLLQSTGIVGFSSGLYVNSHLHISSFSSSITHMDDPPSQPTSCGRRYSFPYVHNHYQRYSSHLGIL